MSIYNKENKESIQNMFARIAPNYNLANDILSLGIHRLWKLRALSRLKIATNAKILDICTGTGDLAFIIANKFPQVSTIVGVDAVSQMLEIANARKEKKKTVLKSKNIEVDFIKADATNLPFENNSFDCITIGFGIRNMDNPSSCLRECFRVLKSSGQLLVIEFGELEHSTWLNLFSFYSKHIIPLLGGIITGDKSAYKYLNASSMSFVSGDKFVKLLKEASFVSCNSALLLGGIAHCYIGVKT